MTETAWKQLRDQFRAEARTWQENIRQPRTLTNDELNAVVGSVVHPYHAGAIRQIGSVHAGSVGARLRLHNLPR